MNILNAIAPEELKAFDGTKYTIVQNDLVGLTKEGTLDYLYKEEIIPLVVEQTTFVDIATGRNFVLGLADSQELYYFHLDRYSYRAFLIRQNVIKIWAAGDQFYYETRKKFFGAEKFFIPFVLLSKEDTILELYCHNKFIMHGWVLV